MAAGDASSIDRLLGATARSYDAVFTDKKDNAGIKPSDFLNLMVAQMRNQDFLNPMDETQFVTQMAQFSTMQQMMELAEYSKTNYAMSLVGKSVTASRFTVSGGLDTVTGIVERVALYDNDFILYIADPRYPDDDSQRRYYLSQVMEVHATPAGGAGNANTGNSTNTGTNPDALDASGLKVQAGEPTENAAVIYWDATTKDEDAASKLKYTVYYSTEGPFITLADVKQGILSGQADRENLKFDTIVGLEPGKIYYFNVVVKDAKGNESVYQPVVVLTKGGAQAPANVSPTPPAGNDPLAPIDPSEEEPDPEDGVTEPGDGDTDPIGGVTEPGDEDTDPMGGVTEPGDEEADPVGGVVDPEDGADPVGNMDEPGDEAIEPLGGTDESTGDTA
ncbi:MAG: hypothetical protein FWF83_02120 [Clostridiales bacterium]|nr:hypothetical protein [Clostridiales bacterium]